MRVLFCILWHAVEIIEECVICTRAVEPAETPKEATHGKAMAEIDFVIMLGSNVAGTKFVVETDNRVLKSILNFRETIERLP